jgi:hypothetical protein
MLLLVLKLIVDIGELWGRSDHNVPILVPKEMDVFEECVVLLVLRLWPAQFLTERVESRLLWHLGNGDSWGHVAQLELVVEYCITMFSLFRSNSMLLNVCRGTVISAVVIAFIIVPSPVEPDHEQSIISREPIATSHRNL